MESTALSLGKSVLDGALGYAKSALAEEVALQLGIQRDHAFIRDELEMMQAFLMVAHEERDQHKVLKTWVKQVRDVAYDAEDYLQEFSIHLKQPPWWRLPCTLRERRRIAKKMKELRARVEDLSQRNLRYQLIKNTSSRPGTAAELSSITAATIFGIDGLAAKHDKSKGDLVDLSSNNCTIVIEKNKKNPFTNIQSSNNNLNSTNFQVFKEAIDLSKHPELIEEAKQILKKCNGLPLAIVTIGGFLANQPKMAVEWRKLNEHMSAELAMNQELEAIRTILGKSYEGLPYHLKSCFLYMSVFPEDHKISRRRLIQRWIAEGYSRELRDKSAKLMADSYFMELIQRSMILPSQQSIHSRKGIDSCQVHDLMHEISISKSAEENLVYRMVEGCSSNTQEIVRHLAIDSNWNGDKRDFENIVDLSRVRSLTVFGKWRSFYFSDKMRLLRVLDLEGTSGLVDHDLLHIGKLLHLKYFSLRGCVNVCHLPDSLGNLRQLQTLDITDTRITKLSTTITKLRKLQYLCSGRTEYGDDNLSEDLIKSLPAPVQNKLCFSTLLSAAFCAACCAPKILADGPDNVLKRHDIFTIYCCFGFPIIAGLVSPGCVVLPRGIRKLKALHTLGIVNLSRGKVVIQEIRRLTNLHKLGVAGVNMKNSEEFCLALADLCNLESLLVWSPGKPGLRGCLDGLSSPPKKLQSLKLYRNLVKLPKWIQGVHNLVKLVLRSSMISEHDAAMQVLGELPNLTIMRLLKNSFKGEELCLSFRRKAFPSLMVLELALLYDLKSVNFEERASTEIEERASSEIEESASAEIEETACPKLELVQFSGFTGDSNGRLFSGLASLPRLKEFILDNDTYKKKFLVDVQDQLAGNLNGPILKRD